MEDNNSSTPQNDVNNTDPEAQVGLVSVDQDAGIVSAPWPCTSEKLTSVFSQSSRQPARGSAE
jgi:hypothetical protein